MSGLGLGGYGSSDEDADVPAPSAQAPAKASGVQNAQDDNGQASSAGIVKVNGNAAFAPPMVGPSMPDQGNHLALEEASPKPEQPQMSEREMIHYLTQTPYPMTSLPESPPGSPDPAIDAKFKRFLELKAKGVHFNEDLASKSSFRNPGLLGSMLSRFGIDGDEQYRTALPLEVWDPASFPPEAFKEELLRNQQELAKQKQAAKKSLSASGKRTIEFTSGGTSGASSGTSTPRASNKRTKPG